MDESMAGLGSKWMGGKLEIWSLSTGAACLTAKLCRIQPVSIGNHWKSELRCDRRATSHAVACSLTWLWKHQGKLPNQEEITRPRTTIRIRKTQKPSKTITRTS
jgi:hypothetical protein